MKISKRLLSVLFVILVYVLIFTGCGRIKFNNSTEKDVLITKEYSTDQIAQLKKSVESGHVTFSEFKASFNVQCIRKTHQGYYAVLLQEDGKSAFVFINKNNQLINVIVVDKFKTKKEFQAQLSNLMTKEIMLTFEANTILLPVSSVDMTAHIVQEGIYIIKYSRFDDGKMMSDPVIENVEFVENENISNNDDTLIRDEIPFILEIDKISE